MTFRPVNPSNAVLEATLVIQFDRPAFPPEAQAFQAVHSDLRHELPKLETPPSLTVSIGPGAPVASPSAGTFVLMTVFKRDGTPEARLVLSGMSLAAQFLTYTEWDQVRPKALDWLGRGLDAMAAAGSTAGLLPLKVKALGHRMLNAFVWDGDASQISAAPLFRGEPARLPPEAWRAAGQSWFAMHSSRHAMEIGTGDDALIDALTFDLGEEIGTGWRLRLDHVQEVQFGTPMDAAAPGDLAWYANHMHEGSRATLRGLLTDSLLETIRMSQP